ncbi:MAG: polyphosphate kinase 2 family protein [Rhodospirillales bacterium]|nr:polyphosphate kinase 2 family protein [Rhodospirillales bacterium]MDE2197865.1 polyphosphate kinase 2 family protein [Rhodospirillales bacterium]MDE2575205.1 polyphosphate kinase 2 family protein [Rhodospirillales bacterium]
MIGRILDRCRIEDGKGFRLKRHDPAGTAGETIPHDWAVAQLAAGVARLAALQELLRAQNSWSLLCIFQAIDAGGKDGTIKHVMSGVNPQGVEVTSFKAPGPEELAHDFLWRVMRRAPARGMIGIFNRSHYEEVLVPRVHPHILARQHLPDRLLTRKIWQHRLEDISAFERYLSRQGVVILKFFLHISKEEQRRRFYERMDDPDKNWKFSAADIAERAHWDEYMRAYEAAIAGTACRHAPWFVVPGDHKRFAHLVVVEAMIDALERLDLHPPVPSAEERELLAAGRRALDSEG